MIAKLAYLTSPAPDRFILNIQFHEGGNIFELEISEGHLANIIADGAHYAFRKQCVTRVPSTKETTRSANERAGT